MTCPNLQAAHRGITGPVVVVIMDGVGIGQGDEADAVARARTPNLDRYARGPLTTQLAAHGVAVGMPSNGDMGNSEVGHNAMGAGRIFDQGAKLVSSALQSGEIFQGDTWRQMVAHLKETGGALHLIGLLSDGNVHSHIEHLEALLSRAAAEGLPRAYVHALLDGRDVPKVSALTYVDRIEAHLDKLRSPQRDYRVASGGGRMVTTMDRYESNWAIVEAGWKVHVLGEGRRFPSLRAAVEILREEQPGLVDQEIPAFVIGDGEGPVATIEDGDAVVTFNFRGDRMLELCAAFEQDDFRAFPRVRRPEVYFAGMTLYDGDTQTPARYLVSPPEIRCTLGERLAAAGVRQLACSETQKFGHVTYFWNGNRSGAFDPALETYIEVPSRRPPFDAHPQMRAPEITDAVLKELGSRDYGLVRINYANGDMVGHTGNIEATVASVAAVDVELGRLEEAVLRARGALVITADHGNADDMAERDPTTGAIKRDQQGRMISRTSHSLNPVPFHVRMHHEDEVHFRLVTVPEPGLGNIAATVACLLGYAQPEGFLPGLLAPV